MKRQMFSVGLWLAVAAGCTAQVGNGAGPGDEGGSGGDGGGGGGSNGGNGVPAPKSKDSLARNPQHQLVCADPGSLAVPSTPLGRLTNVEYWNTLRDLLSPIQVDGAATTLPLETIIEGFANNAEGQGATDQLIESLEGGARTFGAAIAKNLGMLKINGCPPANAGAEQACAEAFIASFGKRAYRRPLAGDEETRLRDFYKANRAANYDFNTSLDMVAEAMLQSPQFLYRVEAGEGSGTPVKLTSWELASRLSYLLWDTMPDQTLLDAAAANKLGTTAELQSQVERMLGDARAKPTVVEFSRQWLNFDVLAGKAANKDKTKFSDYTTDTQTAIWDGLRSYLEDALLGQGGGVKKLLTSRKAWVNDKSAFIYGAKAPNGATLASVDLDAKQRAGLLTQAAVLAGAAHDTVQSPVRRGVFALEHIMCAPPPPPPNGVLPKAQMPMPNAVLTTRERTVLEHEGQGGACKSCHEYIDGVGFAFENYDAIGRWQSQEFGKDIDPSAKVVTTFDMDGAYPNAVAMLDKLAGSEQVAQCFVEHWWRYALGRREVEQDGCAIASITDQLIAANGDFKALMLSLVQTPAFRYRSPLAK